MNTDETYWETKYGTVEKQQQGEPDDEIEPIPKPTRSGKSTKLTQDEDATSSASGSGDEANENRGDFDHYVDQLSNNFINSTEIIKNEFKNFKPDDYKRRIQKLSTNTRGNSYIEKQISNATEGIKNQKIKIDEAMITINPQLTKMKKAYQTWFDNEERMFIAKEALKLRKKMKSTKESTTEDDIKLKSDLKLKQLKTDLEITKRRKQNAERDLAEIKYPTNPTTNTTSTSISTSSSSTDIVIDTDNKHDTPEVIDISVDDINVKTLIREIANYNKKIVKLKKEIESLEPKKKTANDDLIEDDEFMKTFYIWRQFNLNTKTHKDEQEFWIQINKFMNDVQGQTAYKKHQERHRLIID